MNKLREQEKISLQSAFGLVATEPLAARKDQNVGEKAIEAIYRAIDSAVKSTKELVEDD